MAFVNSPLPLTSRSSQTRRCSRAPRMMFESNISRRVAMGLILTAGLGAMSATAVNAQSSSIKEELDSELRKLDYKTELFDVGPEKEAELKITEKKEANTPEYKQELEVIREKEKSSFNAMLANEESEAAKIRATFGKK